MNTLLQTLIPSKQTTLALAGSTACALALSTSTHAATLEETNDFSQLATTMQANGKPLVLALEADYCTYCARLKAEHLQPMVNSEDYSKRVVIRTLEFDGDHEVKDFDGQTISASAFSSRYKVRITPTLLFLNAKGEEIAERMLGYNTPELYGAYLDRAIDTAVEEMAE
ncbi:MAG: thioredoxin family protein [Thiolinea sp.]